MGCSRSEKNGATTSHSKTVTTQLPTRLLGNTNIDRTRPFEGSRLTLCAQTVIHLKKFQGRPLTAKALSGMSGCSPAEPDSVSPDKNDYSTRRGEQRERWLHRPFFLRRRGPRVASQPDQPSGPADSAGVALIEAACVARRSNQNTRCQDLPVLNGGWIPADGITKGWIWGAAAVKRTARQPRTARP